MEMMSTVEERGGALQHRLGLESQSPSWYSCRGNPLRSIGIQTSEKKGIHMGRGACLEQGEKLTRLSAWVKGQQIGHIQENRANK